MELYRVIRPIRQQNKKTIKVGQILTAKKNFDRIGGVEELMKGDRYVCDVGSIMAKECCVKTTEEYTKMHF